MQNLFSSTLLVVLFFVQLTSAKKECFANSATKYTRYYDDCFEITDWHVEECAGVGQESIGNITFFLTHRNYLYSYYCVVPSVDWGIAGQYEVYDEVCNIPVNKEHTLQLKYTYQESGTFTTDSTIKVNLYSINQPPHNSYFDSPEWFLNVNGETCSGNGPLPTPPPTLGPTPPPPPTVSNAPSMTAMPSISGSFAVQKWTAFALALFLASVAPLG